MAIIGDRIYFSGPFLFHFANHFCESGGVSEQGREVFEVDALFREIWNLENIFFSDWFFMAFSPCLVLSMNLSLHCHHNSKREIVQKYLQKCTICGTLYS